MTRNSIVGIIDALNTADSLHSSEKTTSLAKKLGCETFASRVKQLDVIFVANRLQKGALRNAFLEGLQEAIDTAEREKETTWANLMRPIIAHCPR